MPDRPQPKPHPHPQAAAARERGLSQQPADMLTLNTARACRPPASPADSGCSTIRSPADSGDSTIRDSGDSTIRSPAESGGSAIRRGYAELHCLSNFSFLRGASHPEELVGQAAALGYRAIAITDRNSLAGVVRAHVAAKEHGIHLIIGAEITPLDGPPIVLLAPTRHAYGRLCRLISRGRMRAKKGECELRVADLVELGEGAGWIGMVGHHEARHEGTEARRHEGAGERHEGTEARRHEGREAASTIWDGVLSGDPSPSCPPQADASVPPCLIHYVALCHGRLFLAATLAADTPDVERLTRAEALACETGLPLVATNAVHYHAPERRYLQDVLTCVREKCTLANAGTRLFANAERHLRPLDEIARRYAGHEGLLDRTVEIATACTFTLDELRYEYPHELVPPGVAAMEHLTRLTWEGAWERYGGSEATHIRPGGADHSAPRPHGTSPPMGNAHPTPWLPPRVAALIEAELKLIAELRYEHYFLTVYDLVDFARSRNILCQGRGSAANSAVCYCLGVTAVDPARIDVLFERFISKERNEPPDIDVDFEHERREEVFQYIYEKYGRERAAIVAEVISYRPRSAVRDVGKALGLSLDRVDAIAKSIDWWTKEAVPEAALRAAGLDPHDRTVRMLVKLVRQLLGFPRHLSQHVGGFVLTESPLCEIVPLENGAMPGRTFIEWDKDDIDVVGLLKVDCLALGMLTAIRRCFGMLREWERIRHEGTEASACGGHEGEENAQREAFSSGEEHGNHQDASGSNRVAEGAAACEDHLPILETSPGVRTVRLDKSDASGGGVNSIEHRGGLRTSELAGVSPLSAHRARLDGRARYASGALRGPGVRNADAAHSRPVRRNGSSAARPDSQPGSQTGLMPPPPRLRAFVPSCLPPVPSCLIQVPPEDPLVYDMICQADTVGVFQIESRAQMSMLPRLKPRCFYDLVIEVAIVRPGPIQGGMVHPYLRRRDGVEPVTYPSEAIRGVLGKTLGVPLFQEQVMKVAVVAAGFTPGEADQLRRSMAAWRRGGQIDKFHTRLLDGMLRNGYTPEFAEQIFNQIRGFGEYGFPESHAASFSLLVYASAWLKRYHPAAFCGALINSQPMGFYAPAQLIADAKRHGVRVLPVDVMHSEWDCTLESRHEGTKASACGGHEEGEGTGNPPRRKQGTESPHSEPEARSEPEAQARVKPAPADPESRRAGNARVAPAPATSLLRPGRALVSSRGREPTDDERSNSPSPRRGEGGILRDPSSNATGTPPGCNDPAASNRGRTPPATDRRPSGANATPALRLGFRLIRGLSEEKIRGVIAARDALRRAARQCLSLLARHPGVSRDTLLRLAAADAFRSLGLDRRQALWRILALDDDAPPLFAELEPDEPLAPLPEMPIEETVVHDYDTIGLSLNAHPIGLVRRELARLRVTPNEKLTIARHKQRISVAGLVINRQRPSTAKGIVFMTLEDETGSANLIVRPQIWERYQPIARAKIALIADGWIERQGQIVHVQVTRMRDLSKTIAPVRPTSRDFH